MSSDKPEWQAQVRAGTQFIVLGIELGLAIGLGWWFGTKLNQWLHVTWMTWVGLAFGFATAVKLFLMSVKRARQIMDPDSDTKSSDDPS